MCVFMCVCLCVCVRARVCVCACVCPPPRPHITSGVILTLNDWLNNCSCFQLRFMALAVDVIDKRDPSNEMRR